MLGLGKSTSITQLLYISGSDRFYGKDMLYIHNIQCDKTYSEIPIISYDVQ